MPPFSLRLRVAATSAWGSGLLIATATLLAYANSLPAPLVFDDLAAIVENPSIRDLSQWQEVFWAPANSPTAGRPLLNFSFAMNYALGGTDVAGYRMLNLVIHIAASLSLLGLVRRTLDSAQSIPGRLARAAAPIALAIALLWALHPIQTSSVTYVSQRAESLMGLCYLGTLYAFARGVASSSPNGWYWTAVVSCWLAMSVKESAVTLPLVLLFFDRTFHAASFRHALQNRRWLYAGLAGSWILLGALMALSEVQQRGVADGIDFTPWTYLATECRVIVQYLGLAWWPHPLVFDYGIDPNPFRWTDAIPYAAGIAVIAATAIAAARRRNPFGFLGCTFFLLLAPTSSLVPVSSQPMAENRLYLPLATVAAATVAATCLIPVRSTRLPWVLGAMASVAAAVLTSARNVTHRSEIALWGDTVAKRPHNARARNFYGAALAEDPKRLAEAIGHYEMALKLDQRFAAAHNNLGDALLRVADGFERAIHHFETAVRLQPEHVLFRINLAKALLRDPARLDQAIQHLEAAVRAAPELDFAHHNLALALMRVPARHEEAIQHLKRAIAINPRYAHAHANLASILAGDASRQSEAIEHFRQALGINPNFAFAHHQLANLLATGPGRLPDAVNHYEQAIRLQPGNANLRHDFGRALLQSGRVAEAILQLESACKIDPSLAAAHDLLAQVRARVNGR